MHCREDCTQKVELFYKLNIRIPVRRKKEKPKKQTKPNKQNKETTKQQKNMQSHTVIIISTFQLLAF